MKLFYTFTLLCVLNTAAAQTPGKDSFRCIISKSLQYLVNSQFQHDTSVGFQGEWYSVMKLTVRFPLMGKPKDYADANCFTTAGVHNELAEIFLTDTIQYASLKPAITNAYAALQNYTDGKGFNFWRLYPKKHKIKGRDTFFHIRQPLTYNLNSKFIKNAANVMSDADDTALGWYAAILQQKINSSVPVNPLLPLLYPYRDKNRKNRNWYNIWNKDPRNSGAFMTWLGDEVKTKHVSTFNTILHNFVFYLPISKCFPFTNKAYIPYGTNDIDAVVNANVLNTLAINKETDSVGIVGNAAAFVNEKVSRRNFKHAAIYYPNRFHLHKVVAAAYRSGIHQLKQSIPVLVEDIKQQQRPDGSFRSKKRLNRYDPVQSTANVLYALLQIGETEKYQTKQVIEKAVHYLLSQMQTDANGHYYWKGGVFFSGGTVVKNILLFKSNAYTTAMIVRCLVMLHPV
jgi:hypothetical protein